jgi:HAD superfamily hydrolase (TIGR01509 family)
LPPSRDICLLFDLDGTLVDSEALGYQGFLDLLPELEDTAENLVRHYRGMQLDYILADFQKRLGRALDEDFEPRYRQRVAELFNSSLNPMPGTAEALQALPYPRCIASAGPQKKIRHALSVTRLDRYFEDEHLFSCYDINKWKPEPDLYLHAAMTMGYRPDQCIVIEDSSPGVQAGLNANMRVLLYEPESHYMGAEPTHRFSHMSELPDLIRNTR